jgi:hypothetical protein
LKPQKICQLSNHTHFKLLLHLFRKIMSLTVYSGSKYYIIKINLGSKLVLTLGLNEQSLICLTSCKTLSQEIKDKTIIPCTGSLLEAI